MVLCVHMYMYCVCKFVPTQHVGRWATLLKCEHTCAPFQGLACCFGICAITHLEDTLAQLEDFVRSDVFRKSIGIFNIFKVRRDYPEWRPVAALLFSVSGRMGSCSSDCSSLFFSNSRLGLSTLRLRVTAKPLAVHPLCSLYPFSGPGLPAQQRASQKQI